jgi:phosphopantothenoylcysteine synthetase/decarboxylase
MNLLLGVSGSVAAIRIPALIEALKQRHPGIKVKIVITAPVRHFVDPEKLACIAGVEVFGNQDEWSSWSRLGDPILHIELGKWADLFMIAPLSANTLAKMACGICDNLLTSVIRAWDRDKPLICAPAMNTFMWENALTKRHLMEVSAMYRAVIVQPIEKQLACGDMGMGAMAAVEVLLSMIESYLLPP